MKLSKERMNELNPFCVGESLTGEEIKKLWGFLIAAFAVFAMVLALVIVLINLYWQAWQPSL